MADIFDVDNDGDTEEIIIIPAEDLIQFASIQVIRGMDARATQNTRFGATGYIIQADDIVNRKQVAQWVPKDEWDATWYSVDYPFGIALAFITGDRYVEGAPSTIEKLKFTKIYREGENPQTHFIYVREVWDETDGFGQEIFHTEIRSVTAGVESIYVCTTEDLLSTTWHVLRPDNIENDPNYYYADESSTENWPIEDEDSVDPLEDVEP